MHFSHFLSLHTSNEFARKINPPKIILQISNCVLELSSRDFAANPESKQH